MIANRQPPEWQYYLNPWWREQLAYATRLSKEECERRIKDNTTAFLGRTVRRAMVSAADFTLHRMTFYNNSFKPFAYVTIDGSVPVPETTVRVVLSTARSVRVFFVVWYAFIAFFTVSMLVSTLGRQPAEAILVPTGFIAAFLAWPIVLNAFGKGIAHGDRRFLTSFLVEELELRQAPTVDLLEQVRS